ncbi:hypothetical protein ONE63_005063 [Megalurothrips usitatus]|uniref:Uncharacterized protein n=1 Tax=Megalurothrips usitatus TaxID=439358 RepID=A0AAV7X5P0_9NEOP|nr:hypothetical protein ONE63_005063 [Megalurothrips usitatus]
MPIIFFFSMFDLSQSSDDPSELERAQDEVSERIEKEDAVVVSKRVRKAREKFGKRASDQAVNVATGHKKGVPQHLGSAKARMATEAKASKNSKRVAQAALAEMVLGVPPSKKKSQVREPTPVQVNGPSDNENDDNISETSAEVVEDFSILDVQCVVIVMQLLCAVYSLLFSTKNSEKQVEEPTQDTPRQSPLNQKTEAKTSVPKNPVMPPKAVTKESSKLTPQPSENADSETLTCPGSPTTPVSSLSIKVQSKQGASGHTDGAGNESPRDECPADFSDRKQRALSFKIQKLKKQCMCTFLILYSVLISVPL